MNPKKVLVVDDEEFVRQLIQIKLKFCGIQTIEAENGVEAIEKALAEKPDLILLDIMMPKMDGVEVLKKLAEDAKEKAAKVVLLTNLAHDPVMKEALSLGALAYLIKADMTPDQLVAKIKEYL